MRTASVEVATAVIALVTVAAAMITVNAVVSPLRLQQSHSHCALGCVYRCCKIAAALGLPSTHQEPETVFLLHSGQAVTTARQACCYVPH